MKQLPAILFFVFFFTCSANAQIPENGYFETWQEEAGGLYTEPPGWSTLNVLALIGAPQTVTQTTDAPFEDYAARLETKTFFGNLIPGLLYTGNFDVALGLNGVQPGLPYNANTRPEAFEGYYKYFPENGDSAVLFAQLWHYNTQTGKRDTVAQAAMSVLTTVSEYTKFELLFTYYTQDIPDSMYVVITSSGGGATGQGQSGSVLYVDQVLFATYTGIVPLFGSIADKIRVYQTQQHLQVELPNLLSQGFIELYNLQQQSVLQQALTQTTTAVPIANLPAGMYAYHIKAAGITVKKGVVAVVK